MNLAKEFSLGRYMFLVFIAEISFLLLVIVFTNISIALYESHPSLSQTAHTIMQGLAEKVGDVEQSGMAVKIFLNNLLITIAPLMIFSLQLLPLGVFKKVAVVLSAAVGAFLYFINIIVVGLIMGVLSANVKIHYIILLFATMVHGIFELFAVSAGTIFGGYYVYKTMIKSRNNENAFFQYLPAAQKLVFKLIILITVILALAAVIESYVSAPLAEKIMGG
ncbi:MAG: stage II sporulation protein M [Firmicutes bacterium]|nr:stage II sporulation protein M [Bacillota bacterium]